MFGHYIKIKKVTSECLLSLLLIWVVTGVSHCSYMRTVQDAPYLSSMQAMDNYYDVELIWVGHATALIRIYDRWIITDPNFSEYLAGLMRRYVQPGLRMASLRPVDMVLVSHTHMDHLDKPSLKLLKGSAHLVAPAGAMSYINQSDFRRVTALHWNAKVEDRGMRITTIPARHFGGRYIIDNIWDGNPYQGYLIQYRNVSIYFAGDTGYDEQLFKKLGQKYRIDIALLPVGPSAGHYSSYSPASCVHLDPFQAIQAFKTTRAQWMVPIHHSTFYRHDQEEMEGILTAMTRTPAGRRANILLLKIGERIGYKASLNQATRLPEH